MFLSETTVNNKKSIDTLADNENKLNSNTIDKGKLFYWLNINFINYNVGKFTFVEISSSTAVMI